MDVKYGCEAVSAINTKGKKSAWETWKVFDEVTTAFLALSSGVPSLSEEDFCQLERFVILLYDRTSPLTNIDETILDLSRKGRSMEAIPPTRAALLQPTKRAVYQGRHCWGKAMDRNLIMPSPKDWGWVDPPQWKPLWTTLPEVTKSCSELIRCGCKLERGCRGHYRCRKASLKCTALCKPCRGKYCDP